MKLVKVVCFIRAARKIRSFCAGRKRSWTLVCLRDDCGRGFVLTSHSPLTILYGHCHYILPLTESFVQTGYGIEELTTGRGRRWEKQDLRKQGLTSIII